MTRVCVFCGSSDGTSAAYVRTGAEVGRALVGAGYGVVYGGAHVGVMGAVSGAALDAGGEVIGVIPEALMSREVARHDLTELRVVDTMHTRKATMHDLSEAFVVLPGGLGTYEELFEVLTWAQLGIHAKPVVVLDVEGYYRPLVALLDNAVAGGFVSAEHRAGVHVVDTVEEMLALLR